MANLITYLGSVWEGTTRQLSFQIVDQAAAGFKPDTLSVTVKDEEGVSIMASTDILSSCDANGNVAYEATVANLTLASTKKVKVKKLHLFIFSWTWSTGPVRAMTEVASIEVVPL